MNYTLWSSIKYREIQRCSVMDAIWTEAYWSFGKFPLERGEAWVHSMARSARRTKSRGQLEVKTRGPLDIYSLINALFRSSQVSQSCSDPALQPPWNKLTFNCFSLETHWPPAARRPPVTFKRRTSRTFNRRRTSRPTFNYSSHKVKPPFTKLSLVL